MNRSYPTRTTPPSYKTYDDQRPITSEDSRSYKTYDDQRPITSEDSRSYKTYDDQRPITDGSYTQNDQTMFSMTNDSYPMNENAPYQMDNDQSMFLANDEENTIPLLLKPTHKPVSNLTKMQEKVKQRKWEWLITIVAGVVIGIVVFLCVIYRKMFTMDLIITALVLIILCTFIWLMCKYG